MSLPAAASPAQRAAPRRVGEVCATSFLARQHPHQRGGDDGGDFDSGDNDDSLNEDTEENDENVDRFNRFRNPMLWSNQDMLTLIKMEKEKFIEYCEFSRPATRNNCTLSHESRVFLFLYRFVHDTSGRVLGALFNIDSQVAIRTYNDILFYMFMFDPHIPCFDNTMTNEELESLLISLRNQQSPGIRYGTA